MTRTKSIFFIFFLSLTWQSLSAQKLSASAVPDGILVRDGTDSVLLFVTRTKSLAGRYARSDYVHPLWSIGGERITLDFPEDHPHHRGIFWAWRRIRIHGNYAGDSWVIKDFAWDIKHVEVQKNKDGSLLIAADVYWLSDTCAEGQKDPSPFVKEKTFILIKRKQAHYRVIDFEIRLKALLDSVEIAGYDNDSELSGFSIRMITPDDISFLSPKGMLKPQWPAMKAGAWVDIRWGQGNRGFRSGVAILTHKDNPLPHGIWNLRQKDSMQNVVFPGKNLFGLSTRDFIVLKYRLVIHDDQISTAAVQDLYEAFNARQR